MKLISSKEFNGEWLRTRFEICKLPTEFVLPSKYEGEMYMPIPLMAYGYKLPSKEFPPQIEKGEDYTTYHYQVAVEVHENYGDDGHTEYQFMNQLVIMYDNEIPKSFKEYSKFLNDVYAFEKEQQDPYEQLNFYKYTWYNW